MYSFIPFPSSRQSHKYNLTIRYILILKTIPGLLHCKEMKNARFIVTENKYLNLDSYLFFEEIKFSDIIIYML